MLHAMVMAGGGGTRFWPRSRQARPKQFLTMAGDRTLLQQALDRIEASALPPEPAWIVTGYGYIRRGEQVAQRQGISVYQVSRFEEKPKLPRAQEFFSSGEYYWNSGIFVWKAKTILAALKQYKPDMHAAVERIADAWNTGR